MKNIESFLNFINEKKITIKRKYTERYPEKRVSTAARVRNAILDAIGDGVITDEEMENILSEIQAHKRWKSQNSSLFKRIRQDGISKICLSKKGQKIRKATRPIDTIEYSDDPIINEGLEITHKERGKIPVNIFVGRYQPFTLGHVKVFEKMYKENGLPIVVFIVRAKKHNIEKTPFNQDLQQSMFASMSKQFKFLKASYIIPTAGIDKIFNQLRPSYEPVLWGFGTDRKSYNYQIENKNYREQLNTRTDFKGFEIKRDDSNISASKVRVAIKNDNYSVFKKMTPKSIHKYYQQLQTELEMLPENLNAGDIPGIGSVELPENPSSLNDFSSQEPGSGDIPINIKYKRKNIKSFFDFIDE